MSTFEELILENENLRKSLDIKNKEILKLKEEIRNLNFYVDPLESSRLFDRWLW